MYYKMRIYTHVRTLYLNVYASCSIHIIIILLIIYHSNVIVIIYQILMCQTTRSPAASISRIINSFDARIFKQKAHVWDSRPIQIHAFKIIRHLCYFYEHLRSKPLINLIIIKKIKLQRLSLVYAQY